MESLIQITRWETRKFLYLILAIQLAVLGLVGLAVLGFDIPFLRQIIGFIYLAFVPGLLFLRVLRLHRLGTIETLLYSVGLSIALVMFSGFFINLLYPLIGISKPISLFPVIATISFIVFILCVIVYKQGSSGESLLSQPHSIRWSELLSPPALFLLLLPLLAALGAFLVYFHQGNMLLLILFSVITLVVILIAFNKFIPAKLYPLAIAAISLSLVWHYSLISPDLTGADIQYEYYLQNQVLGYSIWDSTISSNVNAMLSVVMLAPIYSLILNLDTVWIFKIIYPVFLSLVPLALFQAYRKQTGDKVAFFGAFFFVSLHTFFAGITTHARMPIAELFLALSILLFLAKGMVISKRATLLIIFGLSIVVSHYGISYIYMLYLLIALPLLFLLASRMVKEWRRSTLTTTYVMLFIVFSLAWYMYVSTGSPFYSLVRIGGHIYSSLGTELFSPGAREVAITQAVGLGPWAVEVESKISRIIYHATQLFITVGIIELMVNLRKTRFHREYVAMSLTSMVILAISFILPYFAYPLGIGRIYHITLFFLAPFCILGGMAIFRWLFRAFPFLSFRKLATSAHLNLVVIPVLVPFFLFQTNFINELTGSTSRAMPLALYEEDFVFSTRPEIYARQWLGRVATSKSIMYSDNYGREPLFQEFAFRSVEFPFEGQQIRQDSYIFLRRWNVVHGEVITFQKIGAQQTAGHIDLEDAPALSKELRERNKIYDSGTAQVYGYGK